MAKIDGHNKSVIFGNLVLPKRMQSDHANRPTIPPIVPPMTPPIGPPTNPTAAPAATQALIQRLFGFSCFLLISSLCCFSLQRNEPYSKQSISYVAYKTTKAVLSQSSIFSQHYQHYQHYQ